MTRWLYLLRHAKSAWNEPGLDDFDRPLAPRGRRAASRMAAFMKDHGYRPALVLCSPARRATETWTLMADVVGGEARFLRSLYLASPSRLLAAIRRTPASVPSLLVLAHNPGLEALAASLAGPGSDAAALAELRGKFPTGALAVLAFEIDAWSGVAVAGGRLVRFARPKDLG